MRLLSNLNGLDNVADGSTRKLLTTATLSGSGNAVTAVSINGNTLTYTKGSTFSLSSHTHSIYAGSIILGSNTYSVSNNKITITGANLVTAIGNNAVSNSLNIKTSLPSAQTTYYLTGVTTTSASNSTLYNTRLSSVYSGVKYTTSTSSAGGSLYIDDREVTTGLYYTIS